MSHPLLAALSSEFDPVIRSRGRNYHQRGAVRILESGPRRVLAAVQGTRRYSVEVQFKDAGVSLSCSCPYFSDGDQPCKHLWALLLTLDGSGYLRGRDREAGAEPRTPSVEIPAFEGGAGRGNTEPPAPTEPEWSRTLQRIRDGQARAGRRGDRSWPEERTVCYVFDAPRTLAGGMACVHLFYRDAPPGRDPRPARQIPLEDLRRVRDRRDRSILAVLRGTHYAEEYGGSVSGYQQVGLSSGMLYPTYRLDTDLLRHLLPRMCATGRLYLQTAEGEPFAGPPIRWDEGEPWSLHLELGASGHKAGGVAFRGLLRRNGAIVNLEVPELLMSGGLMFAGGLLSRYRDFGCFAWILSLRRQRRIRAAAEELPALLARLLAFPRLPPLEIADSLGIACVRARPVPRLKIARAAALGYPSTGGALAGMLSFSYDEHVMETAEEGCGVYLEQSRTLVLRRPEHEQRARERLVELGFHRVHGAGSGARVFRLAAPRLPEVVAQLLAEGWHVEAEGRLYRPAGAFTLSVSSGVDWFEVRGAMRFGESEVPLPALLRALKKGEHTVRLGDGRYGVLPEQWLRRQGLALGLGTIEGDHLRFAGSQALVVDHLLEADSQAGADDRFRQLRARLASFGDLRPLEAPVGFTGELRGYQRQGLGWFAFLDELGFGGCLADDMGLGKTVQVLALLAGRKQGRGTLEGRPGPGGRGSGAGRRRAAAARLPSLLVVPRSLVFNWKEEARRFVPGLHVLEHSGPGRARDAGGFGGCDVVLTTYGTLRNDIVWLKDHPFDYVILDEAQLIKNAGSITTRAVRQVQARRRLALSGTPIENHLGELWSLLEFLNPGLLGGANFVRRITKTAASLDERTRMALARFVAPFILRRTKEQVAPELPEKLEQTLYCELLPAERKQYRELQEYYRRSLLHPVNGSGTGSNNSKLQVLEALLRLRQAACHPGLLDESAAGRPGAKIDLLVAQLEDVVSEERKALVFSQFTSLLAIVQQRLQDRDIPYEYLDGRVRNREARVRRFQNDPECRLFLISLKAGGLGLNLTAAEYVFLLDPWWNPAVELQAIDRTHRIGQDKKVFAYRLIAKDTVEEKVLELQRAKRELADSIITADSRLIGQLTAKDLDFLLS